MQQWHQLRLRGGARGVQNQRRLALQWRCHWRPPWLHGRKPIPPLTRVRCCSVDLENSQAQLLRGLARSAIQAPVDDDEVGSGVLQIEANLVRGQPGVQRYAHRPRCRGKKGNGRIRTVREHRSHWHPGGRAEDLQRIRERLRLSPQVRVGQRGPARGKQCYCLRLRLRSSFDEPG